jgi:hypothetical protein
LNAAFFRLPGAKLVEAVVADLERAGAVHRADGYLVPA